MANPVFPTLSTGQNSALYGVELEDQSMKTPTDGGYVISRPKHTRKPRRSFKTGFTKLRVEDRELLEDFYESVRGGSVIFDWTDPSTKKVHQVRFEGTLSFKYSGAGRLQFWNVEFALQEV
jgi:hypothetical protein